jgi:hypothetical protein
MISLGLTGVIFVIAAVLGRSSGSGMALAWGVLIGGAVAIIAFFESAGSFEEQDWCVRVAGLLSAATRMKRSAGVDWRRLFGPSRPA